MYIHIIGVYSTPVSLVKWLPNGNKMPVSSALCILVQFCFWLLDLPLSLCLLSLSLLLGCTPVSDFVIGLCPIISDNEDGFCFFNWIVTERESSQFSCLVSAKLAAVCSESQPPALRVLPFSPNHVFLVQFYCSILALPLSLCLLSVSFRLPLCVDMLLRLASWLVLCPVNSDNNESFCLFDWIVPECGSSEFRRAASANLAVLS